MQTHEEFLEDHFETGLKLEREWKFDTYLSSKSEINSKSGITVIKGIFHDKLIGKIPKTKITMFPLDGRLGGGYNIKVERHARKGLSSFHLHEKKWDETIKLIHTLMRMLK